jgi:hypothetical protein
MACPLNTDAITSRDPRGTARDWRLKDAGENRALRKTWTPDEFFTWAADQEAATHFDGFEPPPS